MLSRRHPNLDSPYAERSEGEGLVSRVHGRFELVFYSCRTRMPGENTGTFACCISWVLRSLASHHATDFLCTTYV
jgi:hypothetical protein